MSDPATILLRVAEFLRTLPSKQLDALASGSATLEVVPAATRPTPPSATSPGATPPAVARPAVGRSTRASRSAPPPTAASTSASSSSVPSALAESTLPLSVAEIGVALGALPDRAAAVSYLDGLKLTAPQLRVLASGLGIALPSKATKTAARDTIVQWTVGRRADATFLSGGRTGRGPAV